MTELVLIETLTPAVFAEAGGIDKIIENVKQRVAEFDYDISTFEGRQKVISFAGKICSVKTGLDKLGEQAREEAKKFVDSVNKERSRAWDALEDLQKLARKPVTDWDNAEKTRKEALKGRLQDLDVPANTYKDSANLKQILADIEIFPVDESFQEFQELAESTKAATIARLKAEIAVAEKAEADALELEKLRKEAEIRARQDRDEAIRKEAEEKAQREAEQRALAEKEAAEKREAEIKKEAERRELELKQQAERLIKEKQEAEEKAAKAIEDERKRVAENEAKIAAEQAKRDADTNHRRLVNIAIREALVALDIPADKAEAVIKAIILGDIPNTKITY